MPSLPDHIPVVLDIVRQLMRINGSETGLMKVFASLFLAPHRTQSLTALRQRHGHAVHSRDSVKERANRVVDIIVYMAQSLDVLHQVQPIDL